MAYPASITLLPDIIQSSDGSYTETFTIPGTPYVYRLGAGTPLNYPTGMQVIPPTGVSNAVVISGGGYGSWTQVTSAPGLGQFTVDTTVSPTGGQIGFNSGDAAKSVTATYVANTYVNKTLLEAWVTAFRDLNTALGGRGAVNGFADTDGSALLNIARARGVRQVVFCTQTNDTTAASTTSAAWPGTWSPTASVTTNGNSKVRVRLHIYGVSSVSLNLRAYVIINSVTYNMGAMTWVNPNRGHSTGVIETGTLAAGTYTVGVNYDVNTGTATVNASSDPTNQRAVLEIEEIA